MRKVAILGATSHIAKGLIYHFCREGGNALFLFARALDRVKEFLADIGLKKDITTHDFSALGRESYDVVINCVGIGNPVTLATRISEIVPLTERFDNLILEYLQTHPHALYINFSSGAAYGTAFASPATERTHAAWNINNIVPSDLYGIAKLYAEAKHRARSDLRIIDLRVFGYFSRFIDLDTKFLLTELISCVKHKKLFETDPVEITRDYVGPQDLFSLVRSCFGRDVINDVYDVYSLEPTPKNEIVEFFVKEYGLKCSIRDGSASQSPTGIKRHYYSLNKRAAALGYAPRFTSLETIALESKEILQSQ